MESLGNIRISDVAGVERQLAELWRDASSEGHAVVRACALNLMVASTGPDDLVETTRLVARLSQQYPGRALVVSDQTENGDGASKMEVYVSAHCHRGPGGDQVCSEQVTFEVSGEGWKLVPGSLLGLLVGDCPVYTWWRRRHLSADPLFGPLVEMSDRFIVDTSTVDDPAGALSALSEIVPDPSKPQDHPDCSAPGDLAWVRIEPWRELVASFFDPAWNRPYLDTLGEVEMTTGGPACGSGITVAGAYLAGWLASRLRWKPTSGGTEWARADGGRVKIACREDPEPGRGEIASVRLQSTADGSTASFEAERLSKTSEVVRLTAGMEGACLPPSTHKVVARDEVSLLGRYLERQERDPIFTAALTAAARIAGSCK